MNKLLFLFSLGLITINPLCYAQEKGFIKFSDTKTWIVELDDSLFTSNQIISLKPGNYLLKARPQISYNWPSVYVEKNVVVTGNDTVLYSLENNISKTDNIIIEQLPQSAPLHTNSEFIPDINRQSYFKESLILGAVATNWLSFYLKRVADSYHRDYKRASSSSEIKKYKGKFQDFDLYSQLTLGLSTALLSGYIYFTITE